MTRDVEFINRISKIIVKECKKRGYKFASPIIAQAILESGCGRSGLAKYHNYFGLKCGPYWKGASVNMKTKEEFTAGVISTISDNFRAYDSMESGVKGYFDFISTDRYKNLKTATTPLEYLELIKKDGYATSSSYVTAVYSTLNYYGLEKFDTEQVKQKSSKKSVDDIALEVIAGNWGNGEDRKKRLEKAGYDYRTIQGKVNVILRGK